MRWCNLGHGAFLTHSKSPRAPKKRQNITFASRNRVEEHTLWPNTRVTENSHVRFEPWLGKFYEKRQLANFSNPHTVIQKRVFQTYALLFTIWLTNLTSQLQPPTGNYGQLAWYLLLFKQRYEGNTGFRAHTKLDLRPTQYRFYGLSRNGSTSMA